MNAVGVLVLVYVGRIARPPSGECRDCVKQWKRQMTVLRMHSNSAMQMVQSSIDECGRPQVFAGLLPQIRRRPRSPCATECGGLRAFIFAAEPDGMNIA